jgi:cytochrome c oxidase subunit IV
MGLSVWILGFALMTAGWLVDVLFERYGVILAKILYKTGALIVAIPVIYLLWKSSRLIYVHRLDIVLFLRGTADEVQSLWDLFMNTV